MSKLVEMGRVPRILLVEDCDGDAMLFRRNLMRACPDAELWVAHTAEAALVLLQQSTSWGNDPLPDLIVTDLNLPGISGVELIRALKSDHRFRCFLALCCPAHPTRVISKRPMTPLPAAT